MRLNTNMMLLAGYIAVVSAVPREWDDYFPDLHGCAREADGTKATCKSEELCINNACSPKCTTSDGCTGFKDSFCTDVYAKVAGAPSPGRRCVKKYDCKYGYNTRPFYRIDADSCNKYCGQAPNCNTMDVGGDSYFDKNEISRKYLSKP